MQDEQSSDYGRFQDMYGEFTTMELIKALQKVRGQKDDMEMELKGVNAEHEFLAKVMIPERFNEEGIKNMNVEGVGRVGLRADIYASIKAGAKETAYRWLDDIGSGDLIQDMVNPSTLKAFLKNRIKAGEDIPEELFNVTAYQQATITKA